MQAHLPDAIRPPPEGPVQASLDELVEFEVLDQFARAPHGLVAGFAPLALAAALLQALAAPRLLLPWVMAVAAGLAGGILLCLAYRRGKPSPGDTARWRRRFLVLTGTLGLAWGSAGWLFVPAPWQAEMVILVMLAVLSASVLADLGANLTLFVAYICGAMLPTAAARASLGGGLNLALCLGTLVTMAVLTLFAWRQAGATRRSLRIAHENRRLAQALAERTREAEQASLAKSRFIATASHDLRQPVHALGLLLDVLQGQPASPAARATAARMSQVLDSLDALFEGLLDLSRLDSGVVRAQPVDVELAPLLDALADEFGAEAQAKGLALRCRCGPLRVHSDPLLLARVLRNLLANAVRYTARGGIVVGGRMRAGQVSIEVWDSGVGISEEQQVAVFDEFYQVGHPARHGAQGLGLGLAIVRRLCSLLGHAVTLQSRPGRGSVFKVAVPLAGTTAPALAAPAPLPAAPAAPGGLRGRRMLVVDDDVHAREALGHWLRAWGLEVTSCASADEVHAALDSMGQAPDALITDWRLAGAEDGLAIARRVRQRFGAALPAIVITGDALDEARRLATGHAVQLLHKPVRPASLRALLAAQWLPAPPGPPPAEALR